MSESLRPQDARNSRKAGRQEDGPLSTSASSLFPWRRYRPTASRTPRKFRSMMDVPEGRDTVSGEFLGAGAI